jgi:multiple sugar transport system permease protein
MFKRGARSQLDWPVERAANGKSAPRRRILRFLTRYTFVVPALLYLLVTSIYPLFYTLQLSLMDVEQGNWYFVGGQHYIELFEDPWFWNSLKTISLFAIVNTVLHLSMGMIFALLLNENWFSITLRNIMRGILLLPWVFSTAAAGLMWSLLYHPFGLFNYVTTALMHRPTPIEFLGDPNVALWSIVAVSAWKWYPFYMLIILGGLQTIPLELYEAAKVDGANVWHRFRHITLPQLRPILIAISALDIITTFSHVDLFKMMTRGGPLRSTESVAYYIYKVALLDGNLGYGAAISTIMLVGLAFFMVIYLRLLSRGAETGETSF